MNEIAVYGTLGVAATANAPGARQSPVTWTDAAGNFLAAPGYVLMNDLWKYSAGQWTRMGGPTLAGGNGSSVYGTPGVPDPGNIPDARYQAASWTDGNGNFWLFGGQGYDSAGIAAPLNDLWKYSAGEWTWMGGSNLASQTGTYGALDVAAASNIPSARFGAFSWIDSSGALWLLGGSHRDASNANGQINDLWKYSGGEWTWASGSKFTNQNGT